MTLQLSSDTIVGLSPVDRAAIVAVDDVDQLAIASGESRGVGEGEGRCQAQQQGRLRQYFNFLRSPAGSFKHYQHSSKSGSHGELFVVPGNGN